MADGDSGAPHEQRDVGDVARMFAEAWAAPQVDRFVALLAEDVVLLQPVTPPVVGRAAARTEFTRLLRWLPDPADRKAVLSDNPARLFGFAPLPMDA